MGKEMRCLVVTPNDPSTFGGVERFVQTLVHSLSPMGVAFDVIHQGMTSFKPSRYDRYGVGEMRRALHISRAASAMLRQSHFDLVIVNGITGWALQSSVPVISIHHGTIRGATRAMARALPEKGSAYSRLRRGIVGLWTYWVPGTCEALIARRAALNIAVSTSVREELAGLYGVDPARVRIIQNGVNVEHFRPMAREACRFALGIPADKFVVLFTGRNEGRKGVGTLSHISRILRESDPGIEVLAAADRPLPSPHIKTITGVSYADLPRLYSAADVFMFPSLYEGCSFSVIEAMACGLPVVMTDVGHGTDIRRQSELLAPYIIPVDSPPERFADAVLMLRRDGDARAALGIEARKYVMEHNSVASMAQSYLGLFQEFVGRAGGQSL